MKQAIAGVAPAESTEVAVMVVWPSIAAFSSGRFLGRLFSIRWPDVYIFRLGSLFALLSIPYALLLYFWRLLPRVGRRYTLTNRRVVVQTAITGIDLAAIELDGFDSIEIDVLPGQAWFNAGDLSFRRHGQRSVSTRRRAVAGGVSAELPQIAPGLRGREASARARAAHEVRLNRPETPRGSVQQHRQLAAIVMDQFGAVRQNAEDVDHGLPRPLAHAVPVLLDQGQTNLESLLVHAAAGEGLG